MKQIDAIDIVEALKFRGVEDFYRFYGIYKARVANISDPEKRGRVQLIIPIMGQDKPLEVWVSPSFAGAGKDRGFFWVPEVGDVVRVTFERGDSAYPVVYISGWYGTEDLPSEFAYSANGLPEKKGFITRLGHRLVFSDTPNDEFVHLSCHFPDSTDKALTDHSLSSDRTKGTNSFIDISKNGLTLSNDNGAVISLDSENKAITIIDQNGNSISMTDEGISITDKKGQSIFMDGTSININSAKDVTLSATTVSVNAGSIFLGKNATFSSVIGELLLTYLSTHVHSITTPAPGSPTTPPVIPPSTSLLSKSTKVGL